eukprot:m.334261 g.334261  ORF g.334261 m.334261 type:complete len:647 (-) comp17321_c0_seq1:72-2012(-)
MVRGGAIVTIFVTFIIQSASSDKEKLSTITFQYLGHNSRGHDNGLEDGKYSFTGSDPLPFAIHVWNSASKDEASVKVGNTFTVNADEEFPTNTYFYISHSETPQNTVETIHIHTSCSAGGIIVGDIFGSLKVVALETTAGGSTSCPSEGSYSKSQSKSKSSDDDDDNGCKKTKITALGLMYLGHDMDSMANVQAEDGKYSVQTVSRLPAIATVVSSGSTVSVSVGETFVLGDGSNKFATNTLIEIYDQNTKVSEIRFHSSCSGSGIYVSDVFGSLKVVSMQTTEEASALFCSKSVCDGDEEPRLASSVATTIDFTSPDVSAVSQPEDPTTVATITDTTVTTTDTTLSTTITTTTTVTVTATTITETKTLTSTKTSTPIRVAPVTTTTKPETTDTTDSTSSSPFLLSTSAAAPIQNTQFGFCGVYIHSFGAVSNGVCSNATRQDYVILNASVGFTRQICVSFDTNVGSAPTTLHLTLQPRCKLSPGDPQGWTICSYLEDPAAILCQARAASGQSTECCNYVNSFIAPPLVDDNQLACQEYFEGECNTAYGYSGSTKGVTSDIQRFSFELVSCEGAIPPNPQCQAQTFDSVATVGDFGTVSFVGFGMLLLSLAMYLRRKRLLNEPTKASFAPVEEASPLLDNTLLATQ